MCKPTTTESSPVAVAASPLKLVCPCRPFLKVECVFGMRIRLKESNTSFVLLL
jgi:hypothetical protein